MRLVVTHLVGAAMRRSMGMIGVLVRRGCMLRFERIGEDVSRQLWIAALVTLAVCALSGPAFGKDLPSVKIGAAGPFTGDLSKIGLDSLNAIRMAVDEANAEGGVAGRKIEIVVGDDAGDPARAVTVADKFAMDRSVLGVIGPMNSGAVNAALPTYQRAGLVIISQSATNPSLTERGYSVMHRICPRDDAQGPAAARFIAEELGAKTVYVIDDKGAYGQGLGDQVAAALEKAGVKVGRGQITPEDRDFSPILTKVKAAAPDLLYLALPNPAQAAALIKQAVGLGLRPKLMGGDGLKERDQLIAGAGGAAEGMYVTAIGRDIKDVPEAQKFIKAFEGKYGAMSIFSGQSYEATKLLIDAMRKAAGSDPLALTRASVLQAVHRTQGYRGILGFPISFDSKGDVLGASIYVFQVKGGDFVQVKEYPAWAR
ncbi:MAG: branched-chain amino acid ABC transporter substrate-binding protein [Firmicutes bacterium]|jgi:branched-chain amino acid transport system substrate-binding protein|nr:branched-chain amino acid ABC transporter substrate-binding protein [Bacillota bacterium]MDH7496553.1 branched-chain amino acid ABC transporter substrate-binding protein [Bacillota bacterium]